MKNPKELILYLEDEEFWPSPEGQKILELLSKHPNCNVLAKIACCEFTPIEILEELSNNNDFYICTNVASNKNATQDILRNITNRSIQSLKNSTESTHSLRNFEIQTLIAVAKNSNTPTDVMEVLANSEYPSILEALLENQNLTTEIKKILLDNVNSHREVRSHLAACEKDVSILIYIANNEKNLGVIFNLAKNPNCTTEIFELLSKYNDDNTHIHIKEQLAINPSTPNWLLDNLAKSKNLQVRAFVAHNKNTSISTLEKLSEDKCSGVRENVATNPNTPKETLITLMNDKDNVVRHATTNHPNFDFEAYKTTLKEMYIKAIDETTSVENIHYNLLKIDR